MFRIWRAPGVSHTCQLARRTLVTEPAGLEQQLEAAKDLMSLVQIPGTGRGLVASRDISQGTSVFSEFPMLLAPSPHGIDQACYHCLKPLPPHQSKPQQVQQAQGVAQQEAQQGHGQSGEGPGNGGIEGPEGRPGGEPAAATAAAGAAAMEAKEAKESSPRFCSTNCRTSANREYWQVERLCNFGPLRAACRETGEKLPLMAARLACTIVTQWQSGGVDVLRGGRVGGAAGAAGAAGKVLRGDAVEHLSALCFANIASPPPPWEAAHRLLLQGLLSHPSNSNMGSAWREAVPRTFSLDWYCWVLSRLHINVFRVDTVPELAALDPGSLLKAAASLLSDSAPASAAAHSTGSGAYLLASMLNHSCEPNLDVVFPRNNAVLALVASRDISAGEQLCISYVDADMAHQRRQEALQFSYGFACQCPKCREGR